MTKHNRQRSLFPITRNRRSPARKHSRLCGIEMLEARRLMATDLSPISNVTLYAGTTLNIALDGHDTEGDALTYTVGTSNSLLSASVLQGNRSLKMSVRGYGDMIFELFEQQAPETIARITQLAQSGFYNGLTFHRIIQNFMIQGGDPAGNGTGGSGVEFDDEFSADLQFTSAGILAMAKGGDDTNDSQFFITSGPTRHLDYNHTIFGFLTEGDSVRRAIAAVPVVDTSKPVNNVVIDSVSVFYDQENGILQLRAPEGTTGQTSVTVTARDVHGNTVTRTFTVTIAADPTNNYPYLNDINAIHTTVNTPVTITIPATDLEGNAIYYWGDADNNSHLTVSVDSTTGVATITPDGTPGVYGVKLAVRPVSPSDYFEGRDVWDSQTVPVYVNPAKPTVTLLTDSGASTSDGITTFNNSAANRLQFRVSNVTAGATVTIFADGHAIGQATVGSGATQVTIETDGAYQLSDGQHTITVVQKIANVTADIGNEHIATDLVSPTSDALVLQVDTVAPQITSTAVVLALEGQAYRYDVQSNEESGGKITYSLVQAPAGMTIADPKTGEIHWTPGTSQAAVYHVVVRATDAAGNFTEQSFDLTLASAAQIRPIDDQFVAEGSRLTFQVEADAEPDMLPLTFSLVDPPAGATIDAATGEFSWTPSEAQGPGQYAIVIQATTQAGAASSVTVHVTVGEVNQAPSMAEIIDRAISEGQLLEFDVAATDLDLPDPGLVFSLTEAPQGASIDPATGRFQWRPSELQGGQEYTMTVRVTDSAGTFAERTFTVSVREVNTPPQVEPIDARSVMPGSTLTLDVKAWDPDRPSRSLRYSLEPGAPIGASIDAQTGRFTWSIPSATPGQSMEIRVRVTEVAPAGEEALSTVQTIRLTIVGNNFAATDTAINDLNKERDDLLASMRRPEASYQQAIGRQAGRVALAANPANVASIQSLFNRGQLLGRVIGSDAGADGNSSLQPPGEKKDSKSDNKGDDSPRERDEAPPADQKKSKPSRSDGASTTDRRHTAQVTPEAHDVAVQAVSEEAEPAAMLEPETPVSQGAPAAPVQTDEVDLQVAAK